jgi:general stress protein YciG
MNIRKKYEYYHGIKLDENIEVHHILPKHSGGTDDIENLVAISKDEHADIHLQRYKETGNFRDLCAYYMIGYNFSEAHKISSSEGGKIGGKKVYESKVGIFRNEEDRKLWASIGGKIGGKVQAELGLGFHKYKSDPELHKSWSSKGGKKSGMFQNKEFQSEMGKRGGVKNKGFVWINDGTRSFKYTAKQQAILSLNIYLQQNPTLKRGRIISREKKDHVK